MIQDATVIPEVILLLEPVILISDTQCTAIELENPFPPMSIATITRSCLHSPGRESSILYCQGYVKSALYHHLVHLYIIFKMAK